MEQQRPLLWIAFGFVILLLYQAWVRDYAAPPPAQPVADSAPAAPAAPATGELPALPTATIDTATPQATTATLPSTATAGGGKRIHVETDVYDLYLDTFGGGLHEVNLTRYPVEKKIPDVKVRLLDDSADNLYLLQGGLLSADGAAPTHQTQYETGTTEYRLSDTEDSLDVVLRWSRGDGLAVTKTLSFYRGRYDIDVAYEVVNGTGEDWSAAPYYQLKRRDVQLSRGFGASVESYSFTGPVTFDGEKYSKHKLKSLTKEPVSFSVSQGWFGSIQHHFLAAVIPPPEQLVRYESKLLSADTYLLSAVGQLASVPPGATGRFEHILFVGPKIQSQLRILAPKLDLTVDYGKLSIFSQPLFWVLDKAHSVTHNWGWSIILMTLLIKLLFYPLAQRSGRSMAKMRKLAPRLKQIQERYKDDRPQLSKAMMELYQREGANPFAGCWPVLIQMPVFLALYWVLIESVELRQAPFIAWIQDLSSRDPYFILPILMTLAMVASSKMNPPPPDPIQAKVMTWMPVAFGAFFALFPAGLVLYWFVNTLLTALQQWRINKVVGAM